MYVSDKWSSGEVYRLLSVLFQESHSAEEVLDSLPVGVAVLDREGVVSKSNRLHQLHFGSNPLHVSAGMTRIIAEVLSTRQPTFNVVLKDQADLSVTVSPHQDGAVLLITHRVSDSSSNLQMEVLHAIDTPAYLATEATGIVGANPAFLALTQVRNEDLVGMRPSVVHGSDFFPWVFSDAVKETTLKTQAGHTIPVTVKIRTIRREPSHTAIVSVQRPSAVGSAAQGDIMAALERVSGKIAHELNNSMMVVLASADSLRSQFGSVKAIQTDLDYIFQAARRTADMVQDVLTFSQCRPEVREIVGVDEAIRQMEPLLRTTVGAREIDIRTDAPQSKVRLGSNGLETAILKLIQNAADAVDSTNGRIRIDTARISPTNVQDRGLLAQYGLNNSPHARIRIVDNGRGIPVEQRARIFEPFFSTRAGALGLGLSVAYGIVKRAGGSIYVESELGNGSTFTILIPETSG